MKKFIKIAIVLIYIIHANSVTALALSNRPGSDPTGKSQRQIIEKYPWIDPTACADDNPSNVAASSGQGLQEIDGNKLPAYEGGVATEAPINESGKFLTGNLSEYVTFRKYASLGQEYRDYYITMRWQYVRWAWSGSSTRDGAPGSPAWYSSSPEPRKVLVTNPENGKSIITAAMESGPAPWTGTPGGKGDSAQQALWGGPRSDTPPGYLGRVAGLPPKAMEELGAKTWLKGGPNGGGSGTKLLYSWAPDQNAKPGPVTVPGGVVGTPEANTSALGTTPTASINQAPKTPCTCPANIANTGFNGTENVGTAFYFFKDKEGINAVQASGIVGNFMLESGGNTTINPNAQNDKGAFGIAQWLGDRKDSLINYAKSKNLQPQDLNTQLEFTMEELRTTQNQALVELKKATTPKEAAEIWERTFERSGGAGIPQRVANSEKIFSIYGSSQATVNPQTDNSNNSNCNNTTSSSGNLGTSPNGFVFPLKTTKEQIYNGSFQGSEKWCYKKQENCHGTYPAADIFAPTGTVVVAAVPGTVVSAKEGCTGKCSVVIKGDDQFVYTYLHMGAGTVKVKKGEKVVAGQEIGQVGTNADANDTPSHLHFDIYNQSYNSRPSCSRANGCPLKGDMINPQPQLISAFNNLPEK